MVDIVKFSVPVLHDVSSCFSSPINKLIGVCFWVFFIGGITKLTLSTFGEEWTLSCNIIKCLILLGL
jgi:hypothetical protein